MLEKWQKRLRLAFQWFAMPGFLSLIYELNKTYHFLVSNPNTFWPVMAWLSVVGLGMGVVYLLVKIADYFYQLDTTTAEMLVVGLFVEGVVFFALAGTLRELQAPFSPTGSSLVISLGTLAAWGISLLIPKLPRIRIREWWNSRRKAPKKTREEKEFEKALRWTVTFNGDYTGVNPVRHRFVSAWEALGLYLGTARELGFGSLLEKAEELRQAMPSLAREYQSLSVAHKATKADLKRRMYAQEMQTLEWHLQSIAELFSNEHLNLERELESKHEDEAKVLVTGLSATSRLGEQIADVRILAKGLQDVNEIASAGADALSREIEALKPPTEVRKLPLRSYRQT